jgi:biopolymer transport protein ExbD
VPKVKKRRVAIKIDMTPMVDVAFLLLTFFMLTTQFKPAEEVEVILPESNSQSKLPESNVMNITIDIKGRIFLGFDSQIMMSQIFGEDFRTKMSTQVNIEALPTYIEQSRIANAKLKTVIKADADAEYGTINDVMQILQENQITKFAMVTNLEETKKEGKK